MGRKKSPVAAMKPPRTGTNDECEEVAEGPVERVDENYRKSDMWSDGGDEAGKEREVERWKCPAPPLCFEWRWKRVSDRDAVRDGFPARSALRPPSRNRVFLYYGYGSQPSYLVVPMLESSFPARPLGPLHPKPGGWRVVPSNRPDPIPSSGVINTSVYCTEIF